MTSLQRVLLTLVLSSIVATLLLVAYSSKGEVPDQSQNPYNIIHIPTATTTTTTKPPTCETGVYTTFIGNSSNDGSKCCPTKNIDVFIVTKKDALPLMSFAVRSVEIFMACRGVLHIICDPGETALVIAWVGKLDNIRIHELKRPASLQAVTSYHMMQWPQFWADKYASPEADYAMFIDSDAMLALPATCRSLFSETGKIYLPAWERGTAEQFFLLCKEALGVECKHNYMNYYPFLFPLRHLVHLREKMVKEMNVTNFNEILPKWQTTPRQGQQILSQFVIFGNYLHLFHPELVEVPLCFPVRYQLSKENETNCRNYVHTGVHYGWRPCAYVHDCARGGFQIYHGDGAIYNNKFSVPQLRLISEVIAHGSCYMYHLSGQDPDLRPGGCTPELETSLHTETLTYQTLPVDMAIQNARFSPDTFHHLCPSVERRTPDTKPHPDKDNMLA